MSHTAISAADAAVPLTADPARRLFWRHHALVPLGIFSLVAALLSLTDLDRQIAHAWAFDVNTGTFPARHAYWAERLLHQHGRDFIWLIVIGCATLIVASGFRPALRAVRWPAFYAIGAIGASTGLIGALKKVTQVHCPWDLHEFGGNSVYVSLFSSRLGQVDPGVCFPGAHSGSGFALFALYFAIRNYSKFWSSMALLGALVVGCSFAFAQEARGAHFLSHDLWSAAIAWCVCLGLYQQLLMPARR